MRPSTFAIQHNIKFCARFVRRDSDGRQHYRAVLTNRTNGKRISIDYSPSPLDNPRNNMQARYQAIEAAMCWIQHCADALYWHEFDKVRGYSDSDQREICADGRKYRAFIDNADTWNDLVNSLVETD